jgi:hypothetical protein
MHNYCTLFNINYLARGINLYNSIKKVSNNFRLYIFAFDDLTLNYLRDLKLKNVVIVSLLEFEDIKLKNVKKKRTQTEYFWTCTGSTILYLFKKYKIKSCTYLDADLYFYKDPKVLIEEKKNTSCIITKHNYSAKYDQTNKSGIFCVQFMFFKNNKLGNKILKDWREQCIKWCFNRFEKNKFGDQKYLDNWPKKYNNIHILQHLGGGIAPWNVQQYKLLNNNKLQKKNNKLKFDLIFYHFHNLKFVNDEITYIGAYRISKKVRENIYIPYLKKMSFINKKIKKKEYIKNIDFNENLFSSRIFIFRLIKMILFIKNFLIVK